MRPTEWADGVRVIGLALFALGAAACSAVPSSSPATASPEVVCETATWQPTASLTCAPAIAAALAVLPQGHGTITREEFHWGILCPPGVPCAPPSGNAGYVILEFQGGPAQVVYVSASSDGTVSAASPAPPTP